MSSADSKSAYGAHKSTRTLQGAGHLQIYHRSKVPCPVDVKVSTYISAQATVLYVSASLGGRIPLPFVPV